MTKAKKIVLGTFLAISALIVIFMIIDKASAGGCCSTETNETINNYYPSTITSGVSGDDLSAGLAMAMSAGGHQFDFSYQGWQGSITYSIQTDEDEQSAYSGALAHNLEAMLNLNALAHITFTPEQNDLGSFVVIGTTFRF